MPGKLKADGVGHTHGPPPRQGLFLGHCPSVPTASGRALAIILFSSKSKTLRSAACLQL